MPVLSVIIREAEATGLRLRGFISRPGIRNYRRKGDARLLSDEVLRREWNWARGDDDTLRGGHRTKGSSYRISSLDRRTLRVGGIRGWVARRRQMP